MNGLKLRSWSATMRRELRVLYYAARDPRVKWYSKLLLLVTVAYALSPLDLIPDFIPVIGLIDDIVIVPLGIFVALKTIPKGVLQECRARSAEPVNDPRLGRYGLLLVLLVWGAVAAAALLIVFRP